MPKAKKLLYFFPLWSDNDYMKDKFILSKARLDFLNEPPPYVAEFCLSLMRMARVTHASMAEYLGCTRQAVSRWEKKKKPLSLLESYGFYMYFSLFFKIKRLSYEDFCDPRKRKKK